MEHLQSIFNIAEICAQKEVNDFILSPGSRCAPLTISMVRHPKINTKTISDERSAAFIALGIAQATSKTVGLICTSGSAAYNYAPAIAEAYYQQLPMLILTADRPPEWIDQLDGQTIRQHKIYGEHIKASFTFPAGLTNKDAQWHAERIISEAINLTQEFPKGPVHVNIPLREPFYPEQPITWDKARIKTINQLSGEVQLSQKQWVELQNEFQSYSKVLIVAGQNEKDATLVNSIEQLTIQNNIPVIGDIISNLHGEKFIYNHDTILSCKEEDKISNLAPELLITFGKSLISKSLKSFLRKNKPKAHWHIQESGYVADTFQALTKTIGLRPEVFINYIYQNKWIQSTEYISKWQKGKSDAANKTSAFLSKESVFNEFGALKQVFTKLPSSSYLHLANSMPVRYSNYLTPISGLEDIEVFANRGTSGIDGTVSTAYGAALSTNTIVTVITGDLAFFYDRNAWWNNYTPSNLRVILLNNHGGGIFQMIDGPSSQPELKEYFVTHQSLNAENTAKDFNLNYTKAVNYKELQSALEVFFEKSDKPKILEIETDTNLNTKYFKDFKNFLI